MKIGDLVWYNSAGSDRTAIILDFVQNNWLDPHNKIDMLRIFWVGGTGVRPAMYSPAGYRIYNQDANNCFVRAKSRSGFNMFKTISDV